jgi:hypothetical protein
MPVAGALAPVIMTTGTLERATSLRSASRNCCPVIPGIKRSMSTTQGRAPAWSS